MYLRYLLIPSFLFHSLLLTILFAADFYLGYSFFSKLAENALGILPNEKKIAVAFKAILCVAVAVLIKTAFSKVPQWFQRLILIGMLILAIVVSHSIGAMQIFPMMRDAVEQFSPGEPAIPDQFKLMIGSKMESASDETTDKISGEAAYLISTNRFITKFNYLAFAYLFMTFASVFVWLKLGKIFEDMRKTNQLTKGWLDRYNLLIAKEHELETMRNSLDYLNANISLMIRKAQDYVIEVIP